MLNLETRKVVGYEALSRGPAGTELENPEVLFELARDFDLVWDLEALCIENVVPGCWNSLISARKNSRIGPWPFSGPVGVKRTASAE